MPTFGVTHRYSASSYTFRVQRMKACVSRFTESVVEEAALAWLGAPVFVGGVVKKMVAMSLDREAALLQDVWKAVAEIAIGKEDPVQAARS